MPTDLNPLPFCTICGTHHGDEIHCGGTPTFTAPSAEYHTNMKPEELFAEFIRIDCAARIKTLEWVRDHVLINDRADDGPMHVAIERRLREIKDAG